MMSANSNTATHTLTIHNVKVQYKYSFYLDLYIAHSRLKTLTIVEKEEFTCVGQ